MPVIGHGDFRDNPATHFPGTQVKRLLQMVVVLVIPAQQYGFHPFQTDVEGVQLPEATILPRLGEYSLERHLQFILEPGLAEGNPAGNTPETYLFFSLAAYFSK